MNMTKYIYWQDEEMWLDILKNTQTTRLKAKPEKNWRRISEIFIAILRTGVSLVFGALPDLKRHEANE